MSAQPPPNPQGPDYRRAAQDAVAQGRAAVEDAVKIFMSLIYNPVGALPGAFAGLKPPQAMGVGVVFMTVYALCLMIGMRFLAGAIMGMFMPGAGASVGAGFTIGVYFKLFLTGLLFAAGLAVGCYAMRTAFKAAGSIVTDVFLAGAAVLPLGIGFLAGGILGKIHAGLGLGVLMIGFSLTVLVLFTGFSRIAGIKEGSASYAVGVALIIGTVVSGIVLKILS